MVEVLSLVYGLQVINSHRLLNKFAESARVNPHSQVAVVFLLVLHVAHVAFTFVFFLFRFLNRTQGIVWMRGQVSNFGEKQETFEASFPFLMYQYSIGKRRAHEIREQTFILTLASRIFRWFDSFLKAFGQIFPTEMIPETSSHLE